MRKSAPIVMEVIIIGNDQFNEAIKIGVISAIAWYVMGPLGLGIVAIYVLMGGGRKAD